MENETKRGRPETDPSTHKKNRAISLKDDEYKELKKLAKESKLGVSAFIIKKLKLDKNG